MRVACRLVHVPSAGVRLYSVRISDQQIQLEEQISSPQITAS